MRSKKIVRGVWTFIFAAVVILLLIGAFAAVTGFLREKTNYSIYHGGVELSSGEVIDIDRGANEFECVIVSGVSAVKYDIAVFSQVPDLDINYTVDGKEHIYVGGEECTQYFNIVNDGNKFEFNVPLGFNLTTMLRQKHASSIVEVISRYVPSDIIFDIVVYAVDEEDRSTEIFRAAMVIAMAEVTDVELTSGVIVI